MTHIAKALEQLQRKLERQKAAVEITEAHIRFIKQNEGPPPKKGASKD